MEESLRAGNIYDLVLNDQGNELQKSFYKMKKKKKPGRKKTLCASN